MILRDALHHHQLTDSVYLMDLTESGQYCSVVKLAELFETATVPASSVTCIPSGSYDRAMTLEPVTRIQ